MARLNSAPTPMFWNCVGFAIAVLSIGASWSISRAKILELEMAEYKLKTGSAVLYSDESKITCINDRAIIGKVLVSDI